MTKRPLIGISGRRKKGHQIVGNLDFLADFDIDMYYSDYAQAVLAAGGMPMHLPLDVDPAEVADHLDGVLLSGGADIEPDRYGAEPDPRTLAGESERDDFELALTAVAFERELPTLGICRGLQVINIHAGGTLLQHVFGQAHHDQPGSELTQVVRMEADSLLGALYGEERQINSLHHQAIDRLGDGLRITASCPTGIIEGIEHESLPVVAVQWHPEMMTTAEQDPIFRWLVDTAARAA
jgi:putative glutamine amidotransferase